MEEMPRVTTVEAGVTELDLGKVTRDLGAAGIIAGSDEALASSETVGEPTTDAKRFEQATGIKLDPEPKMVGSFNA